MKEKKTNPHVIGNECESAVMGSDHFSGSNEIFFPRVYVCMCVHLCGSFSRSLIGLHMR